ncbi:MAG: ParB/RepB/Spo0J family partition protein [Actinomycetota bacterium]
MTQAKGGLGRGLSALLPQEVRVPAGDGMRAPADAWSRSADEPRIATGPQLREIRVQDIQPNPRQPRQAIDDEALEELAASIRSVGLLQPIIVRRAGHGYELVAGERRWRASQRAGLEVIPAVVRDTEDEHLLRDALIENLQRVDLNPLEEAAAYRGLVDDFGATHEEIAARVGKSRAAVTNSLRLLGLAPEVQQRLASGTLSAAHGRAIAALADHGAQARAAVRVAAEQMSVRQTEEMVRAMAGSGQARLSERARARRDTPSAAREAGILEAEMLLSDILGTRVVVESGRARSRVVIEYADFADLDRIVRIIEGEREH